MTHPNSKVRVISDVSNVVGESIVWDDRWQRLVWVDIIGKQIFCLDPETGEQEVWDAPERVTSIGLREDGGAIVGLTHQLCLWDWGNDFSPICSVEPDQPGNRLNEGCVGPDGAFWVGTMQNNIGPDDTPRDISGADGRLYRYTEATGLKSVSADRFSITNTLVWPRPNLLITADTLENSLFAYDVDPTTGDLTDRRAMFTDFPRGLPDGSCLDSEGCIWTARVAGGACLTRVSPIGELLDVVELPCSSPTSCTFGGPDLETLFVTSARFAMSAASLAQNPMEGKTFALDIGVNGHPAQRFGPQI